MVQGGQSACHRHPCSSTPAHGSEGSVALLSGILCAVTTSAAEAAERGFAKSMAPLTQPCPESRPYLDLNISPGRRTCAALDRDGRRPSRSLDACTGDDTDVVGSAVKGPSESVGAHCCAGAALIRSILPAAGSPRSHSRSPRIWALSGSARTVTLTLC